jgi:hypothetical protein
MSKRRRAHHKLKTPPKRLGKPQNKARMVSPVALGVLAVGFAIGFMTLHGYQDRPPFAEEANIAWHVALGHGFRSPMDASPAAPPSAWSAPLYPLVIAAAYRLFGIGSPAAVTAVMLLNAVFFGMIVVGTERLATFIYRSQVPGLLAAGLLASHPLFLFYMADFWDGFMSLAIFVWLTVAAMRLGDVDRETREVTSGGRIRYVHAGALGAGMGFLALTNTSYAVADPVLLYLAFRQPHSVSRWRLCAVACAAAIVVISPWTIRNYEAFGQLIPVRTGTGVQFWVGNAPVSEGWLNAKAFAVHPYVNPVERQSLLTLGEPAYNDLAFKRFEDGLVASPFAYLVNCLRRSMYLLVGQPTEPVEYPLLVNWEWRGVFWDSLLLNASVAILGVGGMVAARRFRYRQSALPVLAACVALPFIATAVTDRYSLPLRWLLVMYAGACVWMLFRWRGAQIRTP